jgi:hypothetical protein
MSNADFFENVHIPESSFTPPPEAQIAARLVLQELDDPYDQIELGMNHYRLAQHIASGAPITESIAFDIVHRLPLSDNIYRRDGEAVDHYDRLLWLSAGGETCIRMADAFLASGYEEHYDAWKNTGKKKICKRGAPCGKICIPKNRKCRLNMSQTTPHKSRTASAAAIRERKIKEAVKAGRISAAKGRKLLAKKFGGGDGKAMTREQALGNTSEATITRKNPGKGKPGKRVMSKKKAGDRTLAPGAALPPAPTKEQIVAKRTKAMVAASKTIVSKRKRPLTLAEKDVVQKVVAKRIKPDGTVDIEGSKARVKALKGGDAPATPKKGSKADLVATAKAAGVKVTSRMNKTQITEAIAAAGTQKPGKIAEKSDPASPQGLKGAMAETDKNLSKMKKRAAKNVAKAESAAAAKPKAESTKKPKAEPKPKTKPTEEVDTDIINIMAKAKATNNKIENSQAAAKAEIANAKKPEGVNSISTFTRKPKAEKPAAVAKTEPEKPEPKAEKVTKSKSTKARNGPLSDKAFAQSAFDAAKATKTGRLGDTKVFISHVWETFQRQNPDQAGTLDEFKQRLIEANRQRNISLSRADMGYALNQKDVSTSEIGHLGSTFHFIRLDEPPPAPELGAKKVGTKAKAEPKAEPKAPPQKTKEQVADELDTLGREFFEIVNKPDGPENYKGVGTDAFSIGIRLIELADAIKTGRNVGAGGDIVSYAANNVKPGSATAKALDAAMSVYKPSDAEIKAWGPNAKIFAERENSPEWMKKLAADYTTLNRAERAAASAKASGVKPAPEEIAPKTLAEKRSAAGRKYLQEELTKRDVAGADKMVKAGKDVLEAYTSAKDIKALRTEIPSDQAAWDDYHKAATAYSAIKDDPKATSKERTAALEKLGEAMDARDTASLTAYDIREQRVAAMANIRAKLLKDSPPIASLAKAMEDAGIEPNVDATLPKADRDAALNALADFHRLTHGDAASAVLAIGVDPESASYSPRTKSLFVRGDGAEDTGRQVFHEAAHALEEHNPDISTAAQQLRLRRAKDPDSGVVPIFGGDEKTVGYQGDYPHRYMGRVYPSAPHATEITSVIMEHFSSPKMMEDLYRRDPEMFEFGLGVMASRGRNSEASPAGTKARVAAGGKVAPPDVIIQSLGGLDDAPPALRKAGPVAVSARAKDVLGEPAPTLSRPPAGVSAKSWAALPKQSKEAVIADVQNLRTAKQTAIDVVEAAQVRAKEAREKKPLSAQAKEGATHLAQNIAAWKVGKIAGAGISQVAARYGVPEPIGQLFGETAVQALTATALHAASHKGARNPKDLLTTFVAEAGAAFVGKVAHGSVETFGGHSSTAALGALLAGKGGGLGTNLALLRSGTANAAATKLVSAGEQLQAFLANNALPKLKRDAMDAQEVNPATLPDTLLDDLYDLLTAAYQIAQATP